MLTLSLSLSSQAALEYATLLKKYADEASEDLLILMRYVAGLMLRYCTREH